MSRTFCVSKGVHYGDHQQFGFVTKAGIEVCVKRMFEVPLDFLVGRKRETPHPTDEHAELYRPMALLNSRYRGKRFDWLDDSLAARLARNSIRNRCGSQKSQSNTQFGNRLDEDRPES
jgi:hypothetical protein